MTVKLTHLAREDLEGIHTDTVEQWGRAQWFVYYRGLVEAFEAIDANPMSGRSRDLFQVGMRSIKDSRSSSLVSI